MRSTRVHGWIAAAAAFFIAGNAWGLAPDDIVVLFNTNSPNSLGVARYYMMARKIPANHLLPVTCDAGDTIAEDLYRTSFVPQVRKGLQEHNLAGSVKCLVTTYGIPLKILARQPTPAEQREIQDDKKRMAETLDLLAQQVAAYDAILPPPLPLPTPSSPSAPSSDSTAATQAAATMPAAPRTLAALTQELNTAANNAGNRISRTAEPAHTKSLLEFVAIQQRVVGIAGLLGAMHVSPDAPNAQAGQASLNALSAQLHDMEEKYQSLSQKPDTPEVRTEMIDLRRKDGGLIGEARTLEALITYLQPENTESCLDNELALVLADQNYPRVNWIMNPKNIENFPMIQRTIPGTIPPTLMVARLDGLTPAKVEAMIDTGLKVEAAGLQGKFYIDARGLRGSDAYSVFDGQLRRTAEWVKEHSTMQVVLDDKPELIQAKDAPDAALYCGWYSLRNYQETAQWVQGAVGYHVASYEMFSLHDPQEKGWVINLLNRGFCGTLGATDEPYLNAFPNPSLFFPLLLSGQFTQGEVWQVTCPMLSWRIGYVGDPLYNPFKADPKVSVDELKAHPVLRNAFAILRDAPAAGPLPQK